MWLLFVGLGVAGGAGLHKVKTTINLMSLFSPDAQIIHDYRWLEDRLGPLVPMEVIVRFDKQQSKLNYLERLEVVKRIQSAITSIPNVGSAMSAVTFTPPLEPPKRGGGFRSVLLNESSYRNVLNKRLVAHREELIKDAYLAETPGQELWRISIRVAALRDIDYGVFIDDIKQHVEPLVEHERRAGATGLEGVTYTGLTPVVYMAERALLDGLVNSFFGAFAMIATVMTIVFRSLRAGLFTMLPNVWPMAVVFGTMSWLGIALDIGTMMTASVAMGVCVDDTVHFANWFRRGRRLGLNQRDATVMAFENSAGAIYQSTVIVALGLVTFALSTFMPTRRFGLLMCTLLACGLVADLVLTPAMLAGYLGRFFSAGCLPRSSSDETEKAEEEAHDTQAA